VDNTRHRDCGAEGGRYRHAAAQLSGNRLPEVDHLPALGGLGMLGYQIYYGTPGLSISCSASQPNPCWWPVKPAVFYPASLDLLLLADDHRVYRTRQQRSLLP
jgi:hypothetical protein